MDTYRIGSHDVLIIGIWDQSSQPINSFHAAHWIDILFKSKNLHLVLDGSPEWEGHAHPPLDEDPNRVTEILSKLKNHNAKNNNIVSVITGRSSDKKQNREINSSDYWLDTFGSVIDFYYTWPTFFLVWDRQSMSFMRDNKLPFRSTLNKLFCCKINHAWEHRCKLIDEFSRCCLLTNNLVSFIDPNNHRSAYNFKYFDGNSILLRRWFLWNEHVGSKQPNGYENCFIDVVAESNIVDFYTEKTVQPIIFEKPFVIYGPRYASTNLQKFGFVLYDELFDYTFDTLPTYNERAEALANELTRIQNLNLDYNEIKKILEPKLKHNLRRLKSLIYFDEYMPSIVKQLSAYLPDDHRWNQFKTGSNIGYKNFIENHKYFKHI